MIITLVVSYAPILDCFKDDGKTVAENAFDDMVIGALRAFCESSLLVSEHNHTDLSLKVLDDALKWSCQKNGILREKKWLQSVKDNVNDLLATESRQLRVQSIHKIRAAMEAIVNGVEKVSTTKRTQLQVCLNRAEQTATYWSDADRQKAIEQSEHKMHQVILAKHKLFDKLSQHHECQPLQEVGTKATGARSKVSKELALKKTLREDVTYGTAITTVNKQLQFLLHLSNGERAATTWSMANTERVTSQLERVMYGITSNEQKPFQAKFSICLIEFEAWWETIGIQALRKTIEPHMINSTYPKMHLFSHVSEWICWIGSGHNFTTDISERLHITNVIEAD